MNKIKSRNQVHGQDQIQKSSSEMIPRSETMKKKIKWLSAGIEPAYLDKKLTLSRSILPTELTVHGLFMKF